MQGCWHPLFAAQPPGSLRRRAAGAVAKADPGLFVTPGPEPDLPRVVSPIPPGLIPAWADSRQRRRPKLRATYAKQPRMEMEVATTPLGSGACSTARTRNVPLRHGPNNHPIG
jgi:hypothetical protein